MTGMHHAYSNIKNSGVPWLGKIPSHWEKVHGGAVLKSKRQRNFGMIEDTVLSLSYGKIIVKPPEKLHGLVPESFETYQIVDPGDIIIRPTDLQNDWRTIRVALSKNRGIITSAYLCFQTREPLTPEYAHLLLLGYDLKKVFYGMGSGLRQNLDWSDFKRLPFLLPPIEDQKAIVAYIGWVDRKINRFIRNRRRLIAVLNEQKQAIINRAVTRGLDPNVSLKPSGIDWLGDVPKHWQIKRLKHVLSRPLKYGANYAAELTDRSLPRYIRITDIDKNGRLIDENYRSIAPEVAAQYKLEDGDILLARSGATVGKTFLYLSSYGPAAHAGYLINARVDNDIVLPSFIYAILQSAGYWRWISSITIQATIQNVSAERYANLWVTIPPISEQKEIIKALDSETLHLQKLIDRADREITLIQEYRTRLIADVVTGKINVRHLAPSPGNLETEELTETLELLEGEPIDLDEEALAGGIEE